MWLPATLLSVTALVVAGCGARTSLELAPPSDGAVLEVDAGAPAKPVGFTPTCSNGLEDWILFDLAAGEAHVYAIRANGHDGHRVHLPHDALYPSVSPDGSQLLYASFSDVPPVDDAGEESSLYAYDLTTHVERLVLTTTSLSYSALSPDRSRLAYTTGFSLHAALADGTGDVDLLDGPDGNGFGFGHPVFDADSFTIVYGGGGTLGSIHADGTGNLVLLSEGDVFNYPNAAFSPDHTQLVAGTLCGADEDQGEFAIQVFDYASLPGACMSGRLLAMDTESSGPNLANDPSWNPNGLVAYASGSDVYVVPASGGTPANVTAKLTNPDDNVTAADPVWMPACAVLP